MEYPKLSSYNDNDLVDCAVQVYARNCMEFNKELHTWSMKLVVEIKRRLAERNNAPVSDGANHK